MTTDDEPSVSVPVETEEARSGPGEATYDDGDSAIASTFESTASLTDSILNYRRIHGRTFSAKGEYWGPNDDRMNEGLDIAHHFHTLLLDGAYFLAPIKDPKRILDIGTGTGLWAIDVADQFPTASVLGIDLSPIQPSWIPPNCQFIVDDVEAPWTWPENHFDFIHLRDLEACVADWPALYQRAFKHTAPGGYFEVAEYDIYWQSQARPVAEDDATHPFPVWRDLMYQAAGKMGKTARNWADDGIRKGMEAAGFVDVVVQKWRLPVGGWSSDKKMKEIGLFVLMFLDSSLDGFALYALNVILGWKMEEIQVLVAKVRAELKNSKNQTYFNLYRVYGRKPEATPA